MKAIDQELFDRTAPKWNCVDYPDGMHNISGQRCLWCGRTSAQIRENEVKVKEMKDKNRKTARDMAGDIADALNKLALDDESPIDSVSLGRSANITFYTKSGQHFAFDIDEVDET
jgi:hypothetical protein